MPPEEEGAPEQTEVKKERSGGLKTILTLVIIVVVSCAAGLVVTKVAVLPRLGGSGQGGLEGDETAETTEDTESSGAPIFYDPIELIVNIEDKAAGMDRFLIVEIFLQMDAETLRTEITAIEPRVKDLFIGILRSRTYDDLKGAQGQDRVRRELIEKVNTLLEGGRVVDASFGKFQIQ